MSSISLTRATPSRSWLRWLVRTLGVLVLSALVHLLVLLWAQREMDDAWSTLPPAAPTFDVQLFVPSTPITLGARAQPAKRAPTAQAVTPPPTSESSSDSSALASPAPTPAPTPDPADAPPNESAPQPAEEPAAPSEPTPAPPPAPVDSAVVAFPKWGRMVYATFGGTGILRLETQTVTEWRVSPDKYEARSETRLPDGEVLLALTSSGQVRPESGIAPVRYTEKSRRRAEQAANFIWDKHEVTFSSTSTPALLVDGTQDRLSFQAQLALLAQAFPDRFQPGAVVAMNVVGPRDVRLYDFRVSGWESVRAEDGVIYDTLKMDRPMSPDKPDVRVEVWLAPKLKWLPARVRLTFANGSFGDSVLREAKFDE